jgi:hypothetical protein
MYIRGKLAERGTHQAARFMRDGFDAWAESTAPARSGQMEKEPAEVQMPNYGGAMTVRDAKRLVGGADIIPQAVKDAVAQAKNLIDMWRKISSWIDSFIMDLQDEIIDNPRSSASLVTFARKLLDYIERVKGFKDILDGVAKALQSVGLGRRGQLRGGVSITWQDVGKYASQVAQLYMWFKNNKKNLEQVLRLKSLQPYGTQVLDAVQPIFGALGMGKCGGARESCRPGFEDHGAICMKPPRCSGSPPKCTNPEVYSKRMFGMFGGAKMEPCKRGYQDQGLLCMRPLTCDMNKFPPCSGGEVYAKSPMKGGYFPGFGPMKMESMYGGPEESSYDPMTGKYTSAMQEAAMEVMPAKSSDEAIEQIMSEMGVPREKAIALYKKHLSRMKGSARKPSARGAVVKQVMRERGVSLPEASRIVKAEGLY